MILDIRKALAYELHDLCARLRIGSCPSHHSPNDVIPLSTTSNVHGQETITTYWSTSLSTRGLLGTWCCLCIHTCIWVSYQYNSSMDNKRLSWTRKYNNNLFIIASRAYFQQSPTCTRVNNLVHIAMWLTLIGHIAMWPTSKEFTSVTKLVHIIMWLRLNEFWGLFMFCLWERF